MGIAESTVSSPCCGVCALDIHDICEGCYRSVGEISAWSGMTASEKLEVLRQCRERAENAGRVF